VFAVERDVLTRIRMIDARDPRAAALALRRLVAVARKQLGERGAVSEAMWEALDGVLGGLADALAGSLPPR
jgi:hypothetical protein